MCAVPSDGEATLPCAVFSSTVIAPRSFRCSECSTVVEVHTRTGALPSRCDRCAPDGAARRAAANRKPSLAVRRNAEIARLRARVAELEHALDFDVEADRMARRLGTPSRETVARAVRRLAYAEGREGTARALLEVAAAARAWARMHATPAERGV